MSARRRGSTTKARHPCNDARTVRHTGSAISRRVSPLRAPCSAFRRRRRRFTASRQKTATRNWPRTRTRSKPPASRAARSSTNAGGIPRQVNRRPSVGHRRARLRRRSRRALAPALGRKTGRCAPRSRGTRPSPLPCRGMPRTVATRPASASGAPLAEPRHVLTTSAGSPRRPSREAPVDGRCSSIRCRRRCRAAFRRRFTDSRQPLAPQVSTPRRCDRSNRSGASGGGAWRSRGIFSTPAENLRVRSPLDSPPRVAVRDRR